MGIDANLLGRQGLGTKAKIQQLAKLFHGTGEEQHHGDREVHIVHPRLEAQQDSNQRQQGTDVEGDEDGLLLAESAVAQGSEKETMFQRRSGGIMIRVFKFLNRAWP